MQAAVRLCEVGLKDFLKRLYYSELNCNLGSHSQQRHEHSLVEGEWAFFFDGFGEGVQIALVVLFWPGNNLNFDVLEGQHADNLSPP